MLFEHLCNLISPTVPLAGSGVPILQLRTLSGHVTCPRLFIPEKAEQEAEKGVLCVLCGVCVRCVCVLCVCGVCAVCGVCGV